MSNQDLPQYSCRPFTQMSATGLPFDQRNVRSYSSTAQNNVLNSDALDNLKRPSTQGGRAAKLACKFKRPTDDTQRTTLSSNTRETSSMNVIGPAYSSTMLHSLDPL